MKSLFLILLVISVRVIAYIPAQPTNLTSGALSDEVSRLQLQWFNNGSYIDNVGSLWATGVPTSSRKGAFVHFSEEFASTTTPPTSTPWIAFISCNSNTTNASMEMDIFTLAKSKGAVAALLYSNYSNTCALDKLYANYGALDIDIYTTRSSATSRIIEAQFDQTGRDGLWNFDSQRLNETEDSVRTAIESGNPSMSGFLYVQLGSGDTDPNVPVGEGSSLNGGYSVNDMSSSAYIPAIVISIIVAYI